MNVLIISGIYPTKQSRYNGVFIAKRYKGLSSMCNVKLYKIGNEYSLMSKMVHNYVLKKGVMTDDEDIIVDDTQWNNVNVNMSFVNKCIKRINSDLYYNNNIESIGDKIGIKKYDIIHAHWAYPTGYIAMLLSKKYNIPYVVTSHGSDIHTIPYENNKIRKSTLQVLENASKAIFVSKKLKEEAIKLGYSGNNAKVIYNGVDLEYFKILNEEKNKMINKRIKVIGYIGRLEKIKGGDIIPKIFNLINKKQKNIKFVIIGNGILKNDILKELDEMNIDYKYFEAMNQKDLNSYINTLDVVVVPSRNESFCCVALEAQACGKKVVASKVGGIPECVGKHGFLVEEGINFEERFANKVVEAFDIKINTNEMISRVKEFSWENTVLEEFKAYNEILK